SISIGATKVEQESDMMIKPFSQRRYWLASNNVSGVVAATYLDDNGAQIKQQLAQ
ncbi:TPA: molecular chaperone, partial [Shigella boydii]